MWHPSDPIKLEISSWWTQNKTKIQFFLTVNFLARIFRWHFARHTSLWKTVHHRLNVQNATSSHSIQVTMTPIALWKTWLWKAITRTFTHRMLVKRIIRLSHRNVAMDNWIRSHWCWKFHVANQRSRNASKIPVRHTSVTNSKTKFHQNISMRWALRPSSTFAFLLKHRRRSKTSHWNFLPWSIATWKWNCWPARSPVRFFFGHFFFVERSEISVLLMLFQRRDSMSMYR